ncbi:MAG TPA: ATP synthase F1 subunit gamma [Deltaproteobacteria bacterium]|nr:ATP synthase F1 subunit gamma [Deltaproteobacteria bacterium]
MATLRDVKRKISSINSTQTITRTMKMVSASKLRRAQDELERITMYAMKMDDLVKRVVQRLPEKKHPLLVVRDEIKKILILSVASDRGLCGAFNMNVISRTENYILQHKDEFERIAVYTFGRKIRDYLQRRKVEIVKSWTDVRTVDKAFADTIASDLINYYMEGEFDRIYLLYTYYRSPIQQVVMLDDFLPVRMEGESEGAEYLYEPSRDAIVDALIPQYVSTKIYYALIQSQTSEHAARMAAMDNATSNCAEMVRYLTLVYNKRRQESITKEMMDIVGGAEALRGT